MRNGQDTQIVPYPSSKARLCMQIPSERIRYRIRAAATWRCGTPTCRRNARNAVPEFPINFNWHPIDGGQREEIQNICA